MSYEHWSINYPDLVAFFWTGQKNVTVREPKLFRSLLNFGVFVKEAQHIEHDFLLQGLHLRDKILVSKGKVHKWNGKAS